MSADHFLASDFMKAMLASFFIFTLSFKMACEANPETYSIFPFYDFFGCIQDFWPGSGYP